MVVTFLGAAPAMAATSNVEVGSNGDLSYKAAPGQLNDVTVTSEGTSQIVTDTGTEGIVPGQGCEGDPINPQRVTCGAGVDPAFPVDKIVVNASNLNDTVTLMTTLTSELSGRDGNDTLNGGDGTDLLKGDDGNDILNGNAGVDFLIGDGPGLIGDDQLSGGDGVDLASYASSSGGVTVDLGNTGPQNTRAGMDSLTGIENVNGSTTGGDILTGDAAPNTFVGSGGDDRFHIEDGGSDVAACGAGTDEVFLDRSDAVRYRFDPDHGTTCETVDDNQTPDTAITGGPGPTNDTTPSWQFTSDEPWADFQCTVVDTPEEVSLPTTAWDYCRPGHTISVQAEGASRVFAVRGVDDQTNEDPDPAQRAFTIDTTPPETEITSGPSGGAAISTPSATFSFRSNEAGVAFVCFLDNGPGIECASPFTTPPLANGLHKLVVQAVDAAGNADSTLDQSTVSFTVNAGGAPAPKAQQGKIIIGSLVLISGSAVKMSRKGRVSISLTCAGPAKCTGRLSITTAKPVSKRDRRLVTLGAKKFSITANKKRRINVRFSKAKMRLAKQLKRFKAKAVIREIDVRGNPRISSRVFVVRAR